tara:strand:+ start:778 stop:1440 length:663 start_codon:yes stop_codon:yes gene_type:complete
VRKVRKSCPFCQHEDRDNYEIEILESRVETKELDMEYGWSNGTARKHMQNHLGDYHDNSNQSCSFCTAPNRADLEASVVDGQMTPTQMSKYLECSIEAINLHMRKHLKPIVQQSAAIEISRRDVNEVDMLTNNVDMLQRKVQEFILESDDLDKDTINSLVKLSREIRESLKYLLEFKGQLVHKREETIVIQQIEVIQKVLIDKYPEVWSEIRHDVAERLQ